MTLTFETRMAGMAGGNDGEQHQGRQGDLPLDRQPSGLRGRAGGWRWRAGMILPCALVLAYCLAGGQPTAQERGAGPGPSAGDGSSGYTIRECLITLINEIDVAAPEAGLLLSLEPNEGDTVQFETVLGHIDDKLVKKERDVAQYELQIAEEESKTDINVRYAKAKFGVATAIYDGVKDANRKATQTVPLAVVQQRRLEMREAELSIEKAEQDRRVASLTAQAKKAALELAEEKVAHRLVRAPITGLIVERYHEPGEWVQAGEPVLRMIQVNKLRVQGVVSIRDFSSAQVEGRPVTVEVELANSRVVKVNGKIDFANPAVDANGQYKVWAEIPNISEAGGDNGPWLIQPGLTATMTIDIRPPAAQSAASPETERR